MNEMRKSMKAKKYSRIKEKYYYPHYQDVSLKNN